MSRHSPGTARATVAPGTAEAAEAFPAAAAETANPRSEAASSEFEAEQEEQYSKLFPTQQQELTQEQFLEIVSKSIDGKHKIYEAVTVDNTRATLFTEFSESAENHGEDELDDGEFINGVAEMLKDPKMVKLAETDTSFKIFAEIAQGVIEDGVSGVTTEKADFLSKLIKTFKYLEEPVVDLNNKEAETSKIAGAAAVLVNDQNFGKIANKTVTGVFKKAVKSMLGTPAAAKSALAPQEEEEEQEESEEQKGPENQTQADQAAKELAAKDEKEKSYQKTKEMLEGLKGQDVAVMACGGAATIACMVVCPPAALAVVAALMFYAYNCSGSSKEEERNLKNFDLEGDEKLSQKARDYSKWLQEATSPGVAQSNNVANVTQATGQFVAQGSQELNEQQEMLQQQRMSMAGFAGVTRGGLGERDVDSELDGSEDFDYDSRSGDSKRYSQESDDEFSPFHPKPVQARPDLGDDTDMETESEPETGRGETKATNWRSYLWNSMFAKSGSASSRTSSENGEELEDSFPLDDVDSPLHEQQQAQQKVAQALRDNQASSGGDATAVADARPGKDRQH